MASTTDQLPILPDDAAFARARIAALRYALTEKLKQKPLSQLGAFQRIETKLDLVGVLMTPDVVAETHELAAALDRQLAALRREVRDAWCDTGVLAWVLRTVGLDVAVLICLSRMPLLSAFDTPAKAWRFCGLHPAGARDDQRYNHQLKAWWVKKVADPCMRNRQSPYRVVYDARRSTRPAILAEGEGCPLCDAAYEKRRATKTEGWDCHNLGGPHYRPSHAMADALRVTAKAVLLDLWRIVHGQEPRYGHA